MNIDRPRPAALGALALMNLSQGLIQLVEGHLPGGKVHQKTLLMTGLAAIPTVALADAAEQNHRPAVVARRHDLIHLPSRVANQKHPSYLTIQPIANTDKAEATQTLAPRLRQREPHPSVEEDWERSASEA